MNLSLYQVSNEYRTAFDDLLEREDEFPAEVIADTLEGLAGNVQEKSINVAAYYKNLKTEIEAMKDYEKNMKKRRIIAENKAVRLINYLKDNMEMCGINKITGPEFTLSIRKSPDSVHVDDLQSIPSEYLNTVVSANKIKIKEALKSGCDIIGVHLESGSNLIIK
jgi:hypothetical protein